MTLIKDAKQVLMKAWSVRFAAMSVFFAVTEAALPAVSSTLPPKTFAILAALSACGTVIARIVDQPKTLPKS